MIPNGYRQQSLSHVVTSDLTILAANYTNLTCSRPGTATVEALRGAGPAVNITNGTAPVWVDRNDGAGGGVFSAPNYTSVDVPTLGNAPAIVSGANPGPMTMYATDASTIVSGGDVGIEVEWVVQFIDQETRYFDDFYAWQGSSGEGETSLRYEWATNSWYLKVRGVDVLQAGVVGGGGGEVMTWRQGDRFRAKAWYRHSTNECGIWLCDNGVWGLLKSGTTTGGVLAPFTSFYWGSKSDGTNAALAMHTLHSTVPATVAATPLVSWLHIGDSTCASYGNMVNTGSLYLTKAQQRDPALRGASVAVPGQNTVTQLATYNASRWATATGIQWAIIRLGLNDIGAYTVAQWMTNIRALIAKLRSDHAGIKVIVSTMTPAYTYWVNTFGATNANAWQPDWVAMNANVSLTGADPLTQADAHANAHSTTMLAGDGKSMIASLTADGIHPKNNGRVGYIGPSELAAIHGAGFLT